MKITQMSNVSWTQSPQVKATCTIDVNGFCIKECKVIDGSNGLYVVSPDKELSKPYTDKNGKTREWEPIVWFPQDKRDTLNDLVANHYDPNQQDYKPYDANGNPVSFNNNNKNVSKTEPEDIPF